MKNNQTKLTKLQRTIFSLNYATLLLTVLWVFSFVTLFLGALHTTLSLLVLVIITLVVFVVLTIVLIRSQISDEQKAWLFANTEMKIIDETTYTLSDFEPTHNQAVRNEKGYYIVSGQPVVSETDLRTKADEIVYQTNAPEFSVVLKENAYADPLVQQLYNRTQLVLVYQLAMSDTQFKACVQELSTYQLQLGDIIEYVQKRKDLMS